MNGHGVRRSPRHEVGTDVLRVLRGEVLPALAVPDGQPHGAAVPVPGFGDWALRRWRCGPSAELLTLHADGDGPAVLTVGVGWGLDAPGLWARMCESAAVPLGPGIEAGREPSRPWCADRIEPGMLALDGVGAAVAVWSADLARCLAWAVLPWRSLLPVSSHARRRGPSSYTGGRQRRGRCRGLRRWLRRGRCGSSRPWQGPATGGGGRAIRRDGEGRDRASLVRGSRCRTRTSADW